MHDNQTFILCDKRCMKAYKHTIRYCKGIVGFVFHTSCLKVGTFANVRLREEVHGRIESSRKRSTSGKIYDGCSKGEDKENQNSTRSRKLEGEMESLWVL